MRVYISMVRDYYDYILIDCMPSLGMITINAFACADSILIPVQAAYLPVKGLQQLIKTIGKVKRQINPKLEIEGILLTMVDNRTNYARDISSMLKESYGSRVKIFENIIPISVRAAEISAEGVSIYKHDPKGKVASAYNSLTEEAVINNEPEKMIPQKYIIKDIGDGIAIYKCFSDADKEVQKFFDYALINTDNLPHDKKELLKTGIELYGEDELYEFLQAYSS